MKYIAFACLLFFSCKPAAKTTASFPPDARDNAIIATPHVTVYQTTGVFIPDTTVRRH